MSIDPVDQALRLALLYQERETLQIALCLESETYEPDQLWMLTCADKIRNLSNQLEAEPGYFDWLQVRFSRCYGLTTT